MPLAARVLLFSLAASMPSLAFAAPSAPAPAASAATNFDAYVPSAAELEGRIIAPCCWTQTIDIHGSEIATSLRQEIRQRLLAGESADSIERSLVERYGQKILAVPPESRLGSAGGLLVLALGAAGVGAVVLLKRWQQHSKVVESPRSPPKSPKDEQALDARVDAELARLDSGD